jgi:TRAP-type C4-dicarboxylate transport system permease large subunit
MLDLPFGKYGMFAIISIMYLIMGMFIDSTSMLVLTLPFVGPLILALGFNTLWFGVVFAVLASIGLVTPPFGLTLFVLHSVLPQHDVMTIARGCLPFLIPLLALVVLLTALPEVVLWLPRIMF